MDRITTERIEAALLTGGREAGDYFLVDGSPMFWAALGGVTMPWLCLIEDAALKLACAEYLRERGAKEYPSLQDAPQPPTAQD